MANKLIYGKNCILLERNISFYEIPADIYLFFLIDPIKLTIIEHIDNESSQEHFHYPILKLFQSSTIFKNWQKLSSKDKQDLYDLNVSNNQEITELIEDMVENESIKELSQITEIFSEKMVTKNVTADSFKICLPIGMTSATYPEYYNLNSLIFDLDDKNLYVHKSIKPEFNKLFLYNQVNRSHWTNIWNLAFEVLQRNEIYIGGNMDGNISENTVGILKKSLVTKSETDNYVRQQNSILLQKYFDDTSVLEITKELENKQIKRETVKRKNEPIKIEIDDKKILDQIHLVLKKHLIQLKEMLSDNSKTNNRFTQDENKYQEILLKIFPYIFPQYTHFIREFSFSIEGNSKKMYDRPDFLALNTDLSVDIIEIKTPRKQLFAVSQYRQNYVFDREVLGMITQAQKYIYNLERSAKNEEKAILKKFQKFSDFKDSHIDIASPKALVIVGRNPNMRSELTEVEKREMNLSLSILKNRYQDILEFLTYDDIVNRIERIISRSTDQINI